jgi:uncharacterized protein (TIGR02246 family)
MSIPRSIHCGCLAALAALCSACDTGVTNGADVAAVEAASIAWKQTFNAGEPAAVTALYAEDAVLSAPGKPLVKGRTAIGEYFVKTAAEFSAAGLSVTDAPLGPAVASGDLGYQWKTYSIADKAGRTVGSGALLTLFHRQGGKWLIVADTWNATDAPVTAGP